MTWSYKTNVGTFIIQPWQGRFGLFINNDCLGSYHSPEAAADDVFMCATGHYEWDRRLSVNHPCELGEWQRTG